MAWILNQGFIATEDGASHIFPEAFEQFKSVIPVVEQGDLIGAFHRRLIGNNEAEKLKVARAWSIYEMATSRLHVDPDYIKRAAEDDDFALKFARIEAHYFVHGGFFHSPQQLLDNAGNIEHLPGVIVQGRYDVVCPSKTAWQLSQKWKKAEFHIVPDAGHSAKEPGIIDQLVRATDKFRRL